MARTTSKLVQEVLGANYDTINCPSLMPYIRTATILVDDVVDCAADKGITYTVSRLTEMEMWLAAWLYTINDPIYQSKTTADSSATYFERSYKDAAQALDTSGCLSEQLDGTNVDFIWGGKPPSEQLDYEDRD